MTKEINSDQVFEFSYKQRGWEIKLYSIADRWCMKLNDKDIEDFPEAPKNERVLEEVHKSQTLPNYSEMKQ